MTLAAPRLCAALLCVAVLGACARDIAGNGVGLTWALQPAPPTVGAAVLALTLADASGAPMGGATVRLEGHMSHAGMAPVIASGRERQPGHYDVPFSFTMAGDWILLVTIVQRDGTRTEHRLDVTGVGPAS